MSLKLQHQDLTDSEIIIQSKGAESGNEHLFPEDCSKGLTSSVREVKEKDSSVWSVGQSQTLKIKTQNLGQFTCTFL